VKLLIANGSRIEARGGNANDTTPLMLACGNGHVNVVSAILEIGDPNLCVATTVGETAYDFAALHGHTYICKLVQDAEKKSPGVVHVCVVEEV
jgi:ankyrin repeat protein